MALVQATLASELESMVPVGTEAEGISNWSTAWGNYFSGATVLGISVTPGSLAGALTTMEGAMVGINSAPDGSVVLQTAITSFWAAIIASAPAIWITAPLIASMTPPPNLGAIAATLAPVFTANILGELDIGPACAAVAAALHPLQLGAIAAITPPPPGVTAPVL